MFTATPAVCGGSRLTCRSPSIQTRNVHARVILLSFPTGRLRLYQHGGLQMRSLTRLRVFLLCCLLMIGMNVILIMGGVDSGGFVAVDTARLRGCDQQYLP